jgi:hypothetical protein
MAFHATRMGHLLAHELSRHELRRFQGQGDINLLGSTSCFAINEHTRVVSLRVKLVFILGNSRLHAKVLLTVDAEQMNQNVVQQLLIDAVAMHL